MDLQTTITYIESLPLSSDTKHAMIAQLRAADARTVATANVDALRAVRPDVVAGPGGVSAKQSDSAQAKAEAYEPVPPTPGDGSLDANGKVLDPLKWAYREFTAAGYFNVSAPSGPLQRWSGEGADPYSPDTWVPALKAVIANYPAGTAMIDASMADRKAGDVRRAGEADQPGIGFPIWTTEQVNTALRRFDSYDGSPETQWRGGISNDEYVALQNRGWKRVMIAQYLGRYN